MNHCLLEVTIKGAPTIRYTQDNKTAIAEMEVAFDGLRSDDPPASMKVVGWGTMAQELQNRAQVGQKMILEGRLRMNTVPRQDGTKEKKAEFTVSKMHQAIGTTISSSPKKDSSIKTNPQNSENNSKEPESVTWDSSPLIPDTDDIPF